MAQYWSDVPCHMSEVLDYEEKTTAREAECKDGG